MKRLLILAALLGLTATVPALANERTPASAANQPVTLTDAQLDQVTAGDLLGLNLSPLLNGLSTTLQSTLGGLNTGGLLGGSTQGGGLLGNTLQGTLGGLLNTASGLLGSLHL